MPVCLNSRPSNYSPTSRTTLDRGKPSSPCGSNSGKTLTIGLINNMPDGALEATERQFLSLLDAASDDLNVCVSFYSIPSVPRGEFGARHIRTYYSSVEKLMERHLDGLIVTGREPIASDLAEEPYWETFTNVLDWARENTYSAIWSCLAAHAAVFYLDGIKRVKSSTKHCGVFECSQLGEHAMISDTPVDYRLPHSRWNGLPEDQLTGNGYKVLTRSHDSEVDSFIKDLKSLFVFFQGHPEYEANTLMLEYRRDVGRYLRSETETYPSMPYGYFDHETVRALTAIKREAEASRREELLNEVSNLLEKASIDNTWNTTAVRIYRNWLQQICMRRDKHLQTVDATGINAQIACEAFSIAGRNSFQPIGLQTPVKNQTLSQLLSITR